MTQRNYSPDTSMGGRGSAGGRGSVRAAFPSEASARQEAPREADETDCVTVVTSASAPARQAQPSLPRRARILIADDEPRIRLALRSCLEAEGYQVEEASDGLQALDKIVQHSPDLMLLDLAMPNMDGMRTLSELSTLHGQLKPAVIVLTAWGSEPAMLKVIGLGADLYLEKPIDPETLRRAVSVVLQRQKTQEESEQGVTIDWSEQLKDEDLGGIE